MQKLVGLLNIIIKANYGFILLAQNQSYQFDKAMKLAITH